MKNIVIPILCFLLLSCSKIDNSKSINIDLDNKIDGTAFLNYFKKIEIVPLETNELSLIKKITKILYYNNLYYIFDEDQKCLLIFDSDGKFKFKINHIGDGPGEYSDLCDFEINKFTNNIELLSPYGKIYIYDLSGIYKETIKIENTRAIHYFKILSKDIIVFYALFEKDRLIFYSRDKKTILKNTHNIPIYVSREAGLNNGISPFVSSNDCVNFFEPFSNEVYFLENNNLKLKYNWNFGKYNFFIDKLPENKTSDYYRNYFKNSDFAYMFFYNIENEKFIITSLINKKNVLTIMYLKSDKTSSVFIHTKGQLNFPTSPQFFTEGIIIFADFQSLKYYVKPEMLDEANRKRLAEIGMENNPVLIKYYFKN